MSSVASHTSDFQYIVLTIAAVLCIIVGLIFNFIARKSGKRSAQILKEEASIQRQMDGYRRYDTISFFWHLLSVLVLLIAVILLVRLLW